VVALPYALLSNIAACAHPACSIRRFRYLCERDNEEPETAFQTIVQQTQIPVCGPFNKEARDLAGMPDQW
jgi:uncharacterized ferritin-like protein (DUF455 family)